MIKKDWIFVIFGVVVAVTITSAICLLIAFSVPLVRADSEPITGQWNNNELVVYVNVPGCLFMTGNGYPEASLPNSCNVSEYHIPQWGDYLITAQVGRSVGIKTDRGTFLFSVPALPLQYKTTFPFIVQ